MDKTHLAFVGSILNLLDGGLTMYVIEINQATELNPWLDLLYGISPMLFYLYKVFAGVLFMFLASKNHPIATLGIVLGVLLYGTVDLYHLVYLASFSQP